MLRDNHVNTADIVAASIGIGALVEWLPPLAAVLTIIWTGIRIYETKTVQRWLGREK